MSDKPKHRFWRGKVLPKLALTLIPLPRHTFCSIDVTNKCNLRCKHCYYFSYDQEKGPELSISEWLSRIEKMQTGKDAFFSCTWVGGEPLLRRELIEKGRRFFRANRVVTNGTLPLPNWPDVEFHVSIDGTQQHHDSIRGQGCYEKVMKNIRDPHCENLNIAVACCLNRKNVASVEDILAGLKKIGHIRHVLFDFMTPVRGVEEKMWITFPERREIVAKLNSLKKTYGDFLGGPPGTFNLMLEENRRACVGPNCVFVKNGAAFDAWGNLKKPCVIGPNADCDRCGCIVPFSLRAWKKPSNLIREVIRDIKNRNL